MRKKHAPEQYAAKPKSVAVKPIITPTDHPAVGVAKKLVSWLDRGGVPPSIILLHGLHFARSPVTDDLPVDTFRPLLTMHGNDNKAISEIMDALSSIQADKTRVISTWLQSNWVKKSAGTSRISMPQKKRQFTPANKIAKPQRKFSGQTSTKPVIVIKKK